MNVEIVCSSRELFGADRSAVRLGSLLAGLGLEPTLVMPEHREERGLSSLAATVGIPVREDRVVIASSAGIEGLRRSRGARRPKATLTIFN